MAIRSGRFQRAAQAAAYEFPIVAGHERAFYRVFNSGDEEFKIKLKAGRERTLKPSYSIDLALKDGIVIAVEPDKAVAGIYDYLELVHHVRSGRFKFDYKFDPTTGAPVDLDYPHLIIDLQDGNDRAWYRLFNSGQFPITVNEGSTKLADVPVDESFDFAVGTNKDISVTSADKKNPISGIYEFLGREK
jgi:hypothetical protein